MSTNTDPLTEPPPHLAAPNNCPFYGRAMQPIHNAAARLVFFPVRDNRCALVTETKTQCAMEMLGRTPDWQCCDVWRRRAA